MTVTEKSAYLRGLFEGLDLDNDKDTTKIIKAMLDVIDTLHSPYPIWKMKSPCSPSR